MINAETTLEQSARYFPNMGALDPDTRVWVYREYKADKDLIEITLFYREPGQKKMRIDAEIRREDLEEGVEIMPHQIRIVQWYDAARAVQ